MIRKKRFWNSVKYGIYGLILLVLYALQTTAGAFEIFGIRPIWVLSFTVAVSMCEGIMAGAVFGAVSGLLCDLGSQALFGFNGLLMLCGCAAISLLSIFLIKVSWKSALLLGGGLAAVRALLEFFFFYGLWGYENVHLILIHSVFPMLIYTVFWMPVFLLLVRKIKEKCDGRWEE
ncbi:MAG: hypothetical protein PHE47_03255 [Oscillospiraceae bacterium]|nr:hypothetical protein [Oscillospiraceae bacterium]